jgi:CheY-like chemotaxis protein/two-component sensor histidine kinase
VDITERKQAEDALKQADRRKDEFLAMLAHELRNPLAPIGAAAELLSFAHLEQQRVKQTSQVILRQVQHMTGLVDDLLDVSRVTRGLVTLEKNDVDIKRVIASAVEQVGPLIEAKRHHLVTDLASGAAHVLGDQKRLVQVVANLLNNSAKYTAEGGHIALTMEVHDHQVLLHVKDNGSGIATDLQPHVFDLFSQANRSADRSLGGLGLGLALVRSLVDLHGGKVACFSEGVGRGSCFTVTLPRQVEHETIHADFVNLNGIETAQRRLRILVVDDNVDAAQTLGQLLEAVGHDVLVEHTSMRALETARDQAPDVCILDIGLPDIDGYQLAQRLRAQSETSACLLVAITGYGQEQDRRSALTAGFDHHLVKPVDIIQLSGMLAKGR